MNEVIDICLVTWHRQRMTRKVIDTIRQNTKQGTYRLVVVDNYSPPEMAQELMTLYADGLIDQLILNDSNRGLEPARNQGLALVESELFVCVDSDCLIMKPVDGKDWLEMMVELMDKHPEYAAISARTQVMIGTGNIFEGREDDEIVEFGHPGGSFRIMRTEEVRKVGGWRDEQAGRGSEERHICGLLREAGWETGFAVKVKCLHLFGDRTQGTDRWGYPADWLPDDTGHSDIWHPVLERGDDPEEIKEYSDVTD